MGQYKACIATFILPEGTPLDNLSIVDHAGNIIDSNMADDTNICEPTVFTDKFLADGLGQYIVCTNKKSITSTSYLSTIMYKVGYIMANRVLQSNEKKIGNIPCIIAMSDGWTSFGYLKDVGEEKKEFVQFTKETLLDYLNNNPYGEKYRLATQEEIIRVVASQMARVGKQNNG